MRALVTGGGGFIGSSIARALLAEGAQVRVLDNFITGFREHVPEGAELAEVDLRDAEAVRSSVNEIDFVFHQAAIRSVPKSIDNPRLTHDCNVNGTVNLLIAAAEAGVKRLVYASSSSAYGDVKNPPNREDMTPDPMSPYAASKLTGEYYCRVWNRVTGLSTVSLRYFNVFGPGQHPESKYSAVFPGFISALTSDRTPEVHWDGEQARDFAYIDDVVNANLLAAKADDSVSGEVFNIGGGRPKSVNEVYRSVSDVLGVDVEPKFMPKRAGDIRSTSADISKAKRMLGWEPQSDWDQAVKATVEWFSAGKAKDIEAEPTR